MNINLPTLHDFVGSTIRTTWINSGVTASPISSALFDGSGTLVASVAQVSSGNGHYYADLALPMSRGWLLNEQLAVVGVNTYRRYQLVHVQQPRVSM